MDNSSLSPPGIARLRLAPGGAVLSLSSISGASPRKELLLELIKTAKTYSRQLEQLSEEVLLEVKKLVDEYCTASAAIKTGENRPHESV